MDSMEYLDCSLCNKQVLYESILCSLCNHWVHSECLFINKTDIKTLENHNDWCCPQCLANVFPFFNDNSESKPITDNTFTRVEYKTNSKCSICNKKVTSDRSINCSQCHHWVHQKCIGSFKTSLNEFESFLHHYSNIDWSLLHV